MSGRLHSWLLGSWPLRSWLAIVLAFAAAAASVPAFAHGLLMKLDAQGEVISGEVYFSNGQKAAGVWVELFDDAVPGAAPDAALQTVQTGADGAFRVTGETGRTYRVRASGDEGHEIFMTIALEGREARGTMIEEEAEETGEADFELPAWAVLGGFLLLSLIPAYWLRKRAERSDAA